MNFFSALTKYYRTSNYWTGTTYGRPNHPAYFQLNQGINDVHIK